jgi:ParB-like chromosome segregation protein Spo0J
MKVETVFIADIKVTNRRREDFGDLEGLADSIDRLKLFQPIVVNQTETGELHLVAGERRLRACRDILKWTEIPARLYSELTADERNQIELEENRRRKDLTPYEVSKEIVDEAKKVAPLVAAAEKDGDLSSTVEDKKPRPGRRTYEAPKKEVAKAIGESVGTLVRAEQHVAAVTKYPELAVVAPTQKDAITVAKNLDKLNEGERSQARSRLLKHDQGVLAHLAEKPPMPAPRQRLEKSVGSKWREWLSDTRVRLASIFNTGTAQLTRQWSNAEYDAFLEDLRGFREDVDRIISDLEEQRDELKQQAG